MRFKLARVLSPASSGQITNLETLWKLDVLDLHSNIIRDMEGLDSLQELRVLNLAGNRVRCDVCSTWGGGSSSCSNDVIRNTNNVVDDAAFIGECALFRTVENVSCLTALTELNLRRNMIEKVLYSSMKVFQTYMIH